jgi:hypothetical protein
MIPNRIQTMEKQGYLNYFLHHFSSVTNEETMIMRELVKHSMRPIFASQITQLVKFQD